MATEKRLIRLDDLMKFPIRLNHYDKEHGNEDFVLGIESVMEYAENLPTVDAVEVVNGRWEPRKDVPGFVRCSVCHDCNIYDDWADGKKWNYCPNCGAKMDGDGNGQ